MNGSITDDIERVLFTKEELDKTVKRLGTEITRDYEGKSPVLISVLTGAFIFMADLAREIKLDCTVDFMALSSYNSGTRSSGEIRIDKDLKNDIRGKDVIIVEDIYDSGKTLLQLINMLKTRGAASIKLCAMFEKKERHTVDINLDYVGYQVPDEFIVGYGLDYAEKYRNLPDLCILKREIYEN